MTVDKSIKGYKHDLGMGLYMYQRHGVCVCVWVCRYTQYIAVEYMIYII